ncbi:hypothetical protein DES53_115110 [Roseimicrobium gellanilyticum]|uniref:Uncharacterized protein n=1 Tax=Roseimicrobium gellanilyticum TaxID=748857 RepID=A0A366H4Y4_9BACT|nr:hypothetical protein [Roseimicrobium gellanilyticum]RBP36969.1 hypothetical protein DES53_115110 [Roseimicrobium gellanilyticum]
MSRRAKLIILAIFLVLLAIPAAYVALTWSPGNPLRFRLEPDTSQKDGGTFIIAIENTSATTVEFLYLWSSFTGDLSPDSSGFRQMSSPMFASIPPRSTHRTSLRVTRAELDAYAGRHWVEYMWRSWVNAQAVQAVSWLREHSPASLHSYLPYPSSNINMAPEPSMP